MTLLSKPGLNNIAEDLPGNNAVHRIGKSVTTGAVSFSPEADSMCQAARQGCYFKAGEIYNVE